MEIGYVFHAIIVAAAVAIGAASTYVLKMKNDNPIEQFAESVIEEETGQKIDLTPENK